MTIHNENITAGRTSGKVKRFMKKFALVITKFLIVLLLIWNHYFGTDNLTFYKELYSYSKQFKLFYKRDSTTMSDTILQSNPYKFKYTMNLGKYDSIYCYGRYPSLEEVKRITPQ